MIYGSRSNGKLHGTVLTKRCVVETMLDLVDYNSELDLSKLVVIEPAAGEGVFLNSILERLYKSSKAFKFSFFSAVVHNIILYEIDHKKCEIILQMVVSFFCNKRLKYDLKELNKVIRCEDFLKSDVKANLIVGNPPYVRHENIPDDKKELYKKSFATFNHRSDLYICFFEKALKSLLPQGQLCYICSNRWLKNQYGKTLRKYISDSFSFPIVINMESAAAFEEDVIAYPAITIIMNEKPKVHQTTQMIEFDEGSVENLHAGIIDSHKKKLVRISEDGVSTAVAKEFNSQNLIRIEEGGFKIGIGVATGADSIFIIPGLFSEIVEPEILLPIVSSKDLRNGIFDWERKFVINPYLEGKNDLVNLESYPRLKDYLTQNKKALCARHTVKNNAAKWYKTIDRIYPELLSTPKLLLPDFGTKQQVYFDSGKYYPHHNLYYITGQNIDLLKTLGAILMSDFIGEQLALIGNKMNGGYVRWQSQNLRKLFIPNPNLFVAEDREKLKFAFMENNVTLINSIITMISQEQAMHRKTAPNAFRVSQAIA